MAEAGHNNPPSQIAFSVETADALSAWMAENPTIETEEKAREAKLLIDRGSACSKDMVDERQSRTSPLLSQVEEIRAEYRQPQNILDRVVTELSNRLNTFIRREEDRRQAEAEKLRREAEEAERKARALEAEEQAAKEDAQAGVLDVDIATTTRAADEAFSRFQDAAKAAKIAERDSRVKIGGGFRRAQSLRNTEVLEVVDAAAAIEEMGLTDAIRATILKESRAYRKAIGHLPEGISSSKTRT